METMTDLEIKRFIQGVEHGVKRGLEAAGKLEPTITVAEAKRVFNSRAVNRALALGTLKSYKKGGRTSSPYILRKDWDLWLVLNEIAESV